jgi:hypothetical protein
MQTNAVTAVSAKGFTAVLSTWPWGAVTAAVAFLCAMLIQRMAGGLACVRCGTGHPDIGRSGHVWPIRAG